MLSSNTKLNSFSGTETFKERQKGKYTAPNEQSFIKTMMF